MAMEENLLFNRLVGIFDNSGDGSSITFADFILALNVLSNRTSMNEKIHASFNVYDIDKDGRISPAELYHILSGTWKESGIPYTDSAMKQIVESTFRQVDKNGDGFIDREEYKAFIETNPETLNSWTVDFQYILSPIRF